MTRASRVLRIRVVLYEFQAQDGSVIELEFEMGKCPIHFGEKLVMDDGRQVTRILSTPELPKMRDYQHEAFHMPSDRHGIDPDVPRYSKPGNGMVGGFPLFANKREIAEFEAKKAAQGSRMKYDP